MLKCYDIKCEGLTEPMGIDVKNPRFSWKIKNDKINTIQTEYEITIENMWHTKVKSDNSLFIEYQGLPLKPKTKYQYKIKITDNHGETAEAVSYFSTGLFGEKPLAKWIGDNKLRDEAPMFIKTFDYVKSNTAYVFISAYGLYEFYINGQKVGDSYFTPGFTSYNKRLQYQMYDIKKYLKQGKNEIKIFLGKGWCCGQFPFDFEAGSVFQKKNPAVMLQMEIDGNIALITDETWKKYDSPILYSEIYHGEIYDSRLENEYKNEEDVAVYDYSYDNLVWSIGPYVKAIEEVNAKRIIKTPKKETVIDFGQNLAGWVKLDIKGKNGDKIRYVHGEVLDKDGNFYNENMASAKNEITFILNGEKQSLRPHFSYQGFRYIKIEECTFDIDISNFTAQVICSDINPKSNFKCSNPLLNRFFQNVLWGQKSNFLDIPTDCPQRSERLGWTGDAQIFIPTASKNADVYAFFRKWLNDMSVDQLDSGLVQWVIPASYKPTEGSAAWGDACIICPWELYKTYGDKNILSEFYPMMKKWIYYIKSRGDNEFLWNTDYQLGDWLSLDAKDGEDEGGTDVYYVATAFYAYSTALISKIAKILDLKDDVNEFKALYNKIVKEFKKTFLNDDGLPFCETHTAYILGLYMDLIDNKELAAQKLNNMVIKCGTKLNTGFVGTPYLCFVLSEYGYSDTAYSLLLREEYPSWLYSVKKGATTVWERWNGIKPDGAMHPSPMNSFNHYSYGCIVNWIYSVVCGINIDKIAYKKSIIKPTPNIKLKECYAEFETQFGKIASGWEYKENKVDFHVTIPCNTVATIILPNNEKYEVGSGSYNWEINY